jgi:hypothetical protein
MTILHRPVPDVIPAPDETPIRRRPDEPRRPNLFADDLDWEGQPSPPTADDPAEWIFGEPAVLSDWIEGEATVYLCRAVQCGHPSQADRRSMLYLIGRELEKLASSTRGHGTTTTEGYCRRGCRTVAPRLDKLRTFAVPTARRFALARLIDAEAASYLEIDSDAARLVAWRLVTMLADAAEDFEADTVSDYLLGEAAMRMAEQEAYDEAMGLGV